MQIGLSVCNFEARESNFLPTPCKEQRIMSEHNATVKWARNGADFSYQK
ncbi:hypothetical protein [Methylocystis echinoides]